MLFFDMSASLKKKRIKNIQEFKLHNLDGVATLIHNQDKFWLSSGWENPHQG
jgi:hypothetical protein